jgi:hypothetical protein
MVPCEAKRHLLKHPPIFDTQDGRLVLTNPIEPLMARLGSVFVEDMDLRLSVRKILRISVGMIQFGRTMQPALVANTGWSLSGQAGGQSGSDRESGDRSVIREIFACRGFVPVRPGQALQCMAVYALQPAERHVPNGVVRVSFPSAHFWIALRRSHAVKMPR